MNSGIFVTLIVIENERQSDSHMRAKPASGVVWGEVLSCDSCGRECTAACGTRQFRTCCFNYLRKRASLHSLTMDPSLRVELWLARSRNVLNTPRIAQTQLEINDEAQTYDNLKDINLLIRNPNEPNNDKVDDHSSYNYRTNI